MPESISHQNLKVQGKQLLLSMGFSENNILIDKKTFEEKANEHFQRFRIDVYASNGKEVAVECGNFPRWKTIFYYKRFGKENVIHIPYPPFFGRYTKKDIEDDELTQQQQKQFLADVYIDQIFNQFKNDPIFDFQEFNASTRNLFDIDNHREYREINPDHGKQKETKGKTIWMNFPSSETLSKEEYKRKLHWGMLYYGKGILAITVIFGGKDPCEEFLGLSSVTHKRVFESLKRLPARFFIRDGFSFWEKVAVPPLNKEWNNPIRCQDLTWEDYEDILSNLENLIDMQEHGFKVGPCLDLAKGFFEEYEVMEAVSSLRDLYSLLLRPHTRIDEIADKIKEIMNWKWYIEQPSRFSKLYDLFTSKFAINVDLNDFKKACRKLRSDPEFEKYYASDEFGE
ncbi:MAG: hypothetical protein HYS80_01880 [Candidatus Aenigmarchaeota archaeon]|nr:hypothetical protein [Candidatus Aenigmarchaeota archaeon]